MTLKQFAIIILYAFIGWILCAATMGIGMQLTSLGNTLIIHAIAAPIFFIIISLIYFSKYNFSKPLQTSLIFISFVVLVDFFIVALVINKSLDMFKSLLGTWIPFILIFLSSFITGLITKKIYLGKTSQFPPAKPEA